MTTFFEHQRFSFKRNYLKNLIFLASSDGQLDEVEKSLIFRIGQKRGLKEWQINEILEEGKVEEVDLPESIGNRMNLLFDLMQILYADGHVNSQEIEFIRSIIIRFNLDIIIVDELIRLFQHNTPTQEEWNNFVEDFIRNEPAA